MLTDRRPRQPAVLADFLASDRNQVLDVPQDDRLKTPSTSLEAALKAGMVPAVRQACADGVYEFALQSLGRGLQTVGERSSDTHPKDRGRHAGPTQIPHETP